MLQNPYKSLNGHNKDKPVTIKKQIVLGAAVAALTVVILFGPGIGIVAAQREGDVVTVQGYVSQYIDDKALFTDGRQQVVIETEGSIQQIPRDQPISLTGRIQVDDGRLELKVVSFEAVATPGAPGAAPAQPEATIIKVSDGLTRPVDDEWVTLRCQVTQQVSGDKYLFTDGTGALVLDTDDGAPHLPVGATITAYGRVDVDDGEVEVSVKGFPPVCGSTAGA
jgi:uncharacterized protein YdeI (BOF family)